MKNLIEQLPYNLESEKIVISSLISEPQSLDEIKPIVRANHFFEEKHVVIFNAILDIEKDSKPIDQISLYEKLKAEDLLSKAGGIQYISNLVEYFNSTAHLGYHSKIVFEKFLARQLIKKCFNIINRSMKKEDVFDLVSEAEKEIGSLSNEFDSIANDEKLLSERLDEIFDDLEVRSKGEKEIEALRLETLPSLNRIIGGIMPTDLIGIYGKEKSTKTSLAHEIALDIGADQQLPVCIFTFENSREETEWKSISMRTGIEFKKLRNPKGYDSNSKLTLEEIETLKRHSYEKLQGSKIIISDKILDEYQIANKLRIWKKKYKLKLCVIDYLMLINSIEKFQNRREELNHLSRFFKQLAMKLEIPIILISQSNESGERVAEHKGLERDANYFIYVQAGEKGQSVKFNDPFHGQYNYTIEEDQFIVTVRGIRHSKGNKSFITQFQNNRYIEVETKPNRTTHREPETNWYERDDRFPI
ncbi:MAG: DnaB-like helicase C-terminal domain-containing protein [Melioribacteraceae bacterium]|nr:MAG: DnaB-like helicase C-terminal domain-containing protein [Melioribacteraceae bacterium]